MAVDWLAIKNDYINGGGSYRKLAEKYGVSFNTLKDRAVEEGWKKQKEEHHNKTTTKTQQKTQEKISDALSDEAATKSRIKAKLMKMAEGWIDRQLEGMEDTGDFRRIVQSCADMGIFESKNSATTEKQNNLLQAIQSTEEIDTNDLPEVE